MQTVQAELRSLRREIRLHRLAIVCAMVVGFVHCKSAGTGSSQAPAGSSDRSAATFDVLTVHRIDVREPDGTLRLAISNDALAPGPVVDPERGEEAHREGGNGAGMVFYNEEGVENGALYIDGKDVGLSMDRWRQDQTLVLGYTEKETTWYSGLLVFERPDHPAVETTRRMEEIAKLESEEARMAAMAELQRTGELGTFRMFVGRDEAGAALIELADRQQRPRLRMSVDAEGEPRLVFLDATGKETLVLPGGEAAPSPAPAAGR